MPVNKDALGRYRIIDRLLSDPNHDYTTADILKQVNRQCPEKVTLRMIQKDVKALEEDFGKMMIRNAGGRGTVKYEDQSEPLFYQELTTDEEQVLREVLKTLGQFEGLDNFTWLDLLKKKLDLKTTSNELPFISFGENNVLQIQRPLLGRLFTAISRKKVIRIKYAPFGQEQKTYDIYPYQLRQYNNRWFLLCNTVANDQFPFDPEFITNFALDRMAADFEYLEDEQYIENQVDLSARFEEIVGVTLLLNEEVEYIYYAVSPEMADYVRTKWIHSTQMEILGDELDEYKAKYPALVNWSIFSIECRPNNELYALLSSFSKNLIVIAPTKIRDELYRRIQVTEELYQQIITR